MQSEHVAEPDRPRPPDRGTAIGTPRDPLDLGRLTPGALLALQSLAGNRAVAKLVRSHSAGIRIQRDVVVGSAGDSADLRTVLRKHDIYGDSSLRGWFNTSIRPRVFPTFSYPRFAGYLFNRTGQYTIAVPTQKPPATLTFDELNDAVIRTLQTKAIAERKDKGHGSLGNLKLLTRTHFAPFVKHSFEKSNVMRETGLSSKQVHLRHFVMGSWFRALPTIFGSAKLDARESQSLAARVGRLITLLGPSSGAQPTSQLPTDLPILAKILHDLPPNLNAGEGPENTLIGFLSHGFSELAFEVASGQFVVERDQIAELVLEAVAGVSLVEERAKAEWLAKADPVAVFEALLAARVGPLDPPPPADLAAVMHEFAFGLGMDFMKRTSGLASHIQALSSRNSIAALQGMLVPIGASLYELIVQASSGPVAATVLEKFLNVLEGAAAQLAPFLKA